MMHILVSCNYGIISFCAKKSFDVGKDLGYAQIKYIKPERNEEDG